MHAGFPGARFASARLRTPTISSNMWEGILFCDRDMETGPSWAGRQGSPKISAMMYQRGGTWDGPSNPIPNVGNACAILANQSALWPSPQTSQGRPGAPALTSPICPWYQGSHRGALFPARCDGDGGHESSCSEALRGRPNRVVAMCDGAPLPIYRLCMYFARHRSLAGPSRRGILMPCSTRTRPDR
jgi:hypothetical protein